MTLSIILFVFLFTLLQSPSFAAAQLRQRKYTDVYRRMLLDTFGISNSTIDDCFRKFDNKQLAIFCRGTKDFSKCEGPPEPRTAWLKKCVSEAIVASGFQIPVYIVHGPNDVRLTRIKRELNVAGVHHVHVHNNYQSASLNKTDVESFFKVTLPGNSDMYKRCVEVYSSTAKSKPEETCSKGVALSNTVLAVGLEHYNVIAQIANCPMEHVHCASAANDPMSRYALVFEDDQHIPKNIVELAVELLLNVQERVGLYMLDDSWFWLDQFAPPQYLKHAIFQNSYERNYSRTVGSYLINQHVARLLGSRGSFYPQVAPIDFQLNYAIIRENITVRWAFPPLTCAGSAGMEETSSTGGYSIWPEFRLNCPYCCNLFFNVGDMTSYLQLDLIDQSAVHDRETKVAVKSKLDQISGHPVRSFSGKQGTFLVQNATLRLIPNLDTLNQLGFNMGMVSYFDDNFIDEAPKGPPIPACTNCRL